MRACFSWSWVLWTSISRHDQKIMAFGEKVGVQEHSTSAAKGCQATDDCWTASTIMQLSIGGGLPTLGIFPFGTSRFQYRDYLKTSQAHLGV